MAACAMVSAAEGQLSFTDRIRIDQILETLTRLKVFEPARRGRYFQPAYDAYHGVAEGRQSSGAGKNQNSDIECGNGRNTHRPVPGCVA